MPISALFRWPRIKLDFRNPGNFKMNVALVFVTINVFTSYGQYMLVDKGPIRRTLGSEKRTPYGSVRGIKVHFQSTTELKDVEEYRGLQYAFVEISRNRVLRFLPAKSPERWKEDTRYATNHKPVCPQKLLGEFDTNIPDKLLERMKEIASYTKNQSEECLWLNIFAPVTGNYFTILPYCMLI